MAVNITEGKFSLAWSRTSILTRSDELIWVQLKIYCWSYSCIRKERSFLISGIRRSFRGQTACLKLLKEKRWIQNWTHKYFLQVSHLDITVCLSCQWMIQYFCFWSI